MAIIDDTIPPERITLVSFSEQAYLAQLSAISAETPPDIKIRVCLEHVSAMPGNGSVSMFNFGKGFGWLIGILDAYYLPYELVRPQKWKKEFSVTSDKNTSIAVCKRLFPSVSLLRTSRCQKEDDGIAEALLMAEYARRKL